MQLLEVCAAHGEGRKEELAAALQQAVAYATGGRACLSVCYGSWLGRPGRPAKTSWLWQLPAPQACRQGLQHVAVLVGCSCCHVHSCRRLQQASIFRLCAASPAELRQQSSTPTLAGEALNCPFPLLARSARRAAPAGQRAHACGQALQGGGGAAGAPSGGEAPGKFAHLVVASYPCTLACSGCQCHSAT